MQLLLYLFTQQTPDEEPAFPKTLTLGKSSVSPSVDQIW